MSKEEARLLNAMTDEERWQLFPIILSEYQDCWSERYLAEKDLLMKIVGTENILRINHIGSTSVPGLLAKPTIDILLEINQNTNLDTLIKNIEDVGYIYSPQPNNPAPHILFMKGYTSNGFKGQAFHIHVRYPGDWNELYFRNYLRTHPDVAEKYATLKAKLKGQFEHDRDAYTSAKTEFIMYYTNLAKQRTMKQIEPISENKNYSAVNVGSLDELSAYSFTHPKTGKEVIGKVFVKEPTHATATEISFTTIPPKSELGYFHVHYKDEETYIILKGTGYYQVDSDCFPIQQGSVIRVAPEGARSLCNTSEEEMVYICIQAKENSIEEHTTDDGRRLEVVPKWQDLSKK